MRPRSSVYPVTDVNFKRDRAPLDINFDNGTRISVAVDTEVMNFHNHSLFDCRKRTKGNGIVDSKVGVNVKCKVEDRRPLAKIALPKRRLGPDEIVNPKRKLVESGLLEMFQARSLILFFENFPVWMLGLELSQVHRIWLPQVNSKVDLIRSFNKSRDGPFYELVFSKFESLITYKDNVCCDLPYSSSLTLISGSLAFYQETLPICADGQVIYLLDTHSKLRKIPTFSPCLNRIKHASMGGATKFETIYSMVNINAPLKLSNLKRDISSYIDYSIRSARPLSFGNCFHVNQFDLLHPHALHTPVLVPSDFSSSGFGLRRMSQAELGAIFGVASEYVNALEHASFDFVPLQILRVLLSCGFQRSNRLSNKRARTMLNVPRCSPDKAPTYLPALQRTLPPAWAKCDEMSQKAAKDDDARIDFDKWDLRILALWPHAKQLISALRILTLRVQFRKLFREYKAFLRKNFSLAYESRLKSRMCLYWGLFHNRLRGVIDSSLYHRLGKFYGLAKIKTNINREAHKLESLDEELIAGRGCLNSYLGSTFFGWDKGSTLLYWRWTTDVQEYAKNGFVPYISTTLPNSKKGASTPKPLIFEKIYSKIKKALERNYLIIESDRNKVKNVIDYFGVEKGESDIRVVFNGTSCGLNRAVWAPNFWLPTAKSMVRAMNYNFKAVDIDLGEMFLNFPLSKKLRPYSGVDITPFKNRLKNDRLVRKVNQKLLATWSRTWMGFRPSPEWACRFYYLAEEFVRGNEQDIKNPLYWKSVILNLLGSDNYNPSLPNVYKWNDLVENIAGEIKACVDDLRVIGLNLEHAWAIARLIASRLQFLGIQDAPRKRRTDNGAWAGMIYHTSPSEIQTTVSVSKWLKGRSYIDLLVNEIKDNPDVEFEFKFLEQIRGYLCHLAMTFEILFPYLKGFHLTLCSHLPKRNEEGWKLADLEWIGYMQGRLQDGKLTKEQYDLDMARVFNPHNQPKRVKPVGRFFTCLKALKSFFSMPTPPIITHRSTNIRLVAYGFVDASKGGFGASIDYGLYTRYRVGIWGADTDADSSNFREFANLVETLEEEEKKQSLNNITMIIATDNSTVESALYKGNSSNIKLFDLIIRLRTLELRTGGKVIVTHVSGNRMKKQGTDGISRGQLTEGISIGEYMLQFCPWNETALERSSELKSWIVKVFGKKCEFLEPTDWFKRGHDHCGGYMDNNGHWRVKVKSGIFVWSPPPAAADAAIEELRKARLKRRKSTHIFIVPRLATTLWLKQLNKACDTVVYLPNHFSFWKSSMHEPLVLGICYPFLSHRPWQLRSSPKLFALGRKMRSMLKDPEVDARSVLLQLHDFCTKLPSLPEDVVWSLLYFEARSEFSQPPSSQNKRKRGDGQYG